MKRATPDPNEE